MNKGHSRTAVLVIFLLLLLPTRAWGDVFIGPRVGTLGVGAEAGVTFTDFVKLRGVVQGFSWTLEDKEVNNIEYDFGMDFLTAGAIVDVHPLGISPVGGSFRLSAGAFYNGNSFDLTSTPSGTVNIGGQDYTSDDVAKLKADVEFNQFAPYVGLGWGTSPGLLPFDFTLDLGVLYQGEPKVSLSASASDSVDTEEFRSNLDREEQDMEDDLSSWTWYPVVMLGVAFTF